MNAPVVRQYSVKKIFGPTIQGEGSMSGTVCHFIRLAGCNMWDGRPQTKAASACPYCDTDFYRGTLMTAEQIVAELKKLPPAAWVTVSGGEPLLQFDMALLSALHEARFRVAVETNGTVAVPPFMKIDHITCSPKVKRHDMKLRFCHDMKVLFPHPNPEILPEKYADFNCRNFYIQPVEGKGVTEENTKAAIAECVRLKNWKLSIQIHKILGVE